MEDEQSGSLRVMSFNIRAAKHPDGPNVWPARAEMSAALVEQYAPDLIGWQEAAPANLSYYRGRLAGYDFSDGPGYSVDPQEHPAISWRRDRLRWLDGGGFWLGEAPDDPHSGPAWGAKLVRSAQWAQFERLADGRQFLHFNTHLDHISELARVNGTKLIVQRAAALRNDLPVIISGDFNSNPESQPHNIFLEAGFMDSFLDLGQHDDPADRTTCTTHYFQGQSYDPARWHGSTRIDWLLISDDLHAISYAIIRDAAPPVYPSDHYPVVVDLRFEG